MSIKRFPNLEVGKEKYDAFLDKVEHNLCHEGVNATLRFKHLKFDGNGEPKFNDLANCLADYLIEYSFSIRRRGNPQKGHDFSKLRREAKDLLRKSDVSGEAGEILLYFLLETVLEAPQLVAKIDLKTNPNKEINGSDGIHMKYVDGKELLEIYFGEAKLEQNIYNALTHAFESLENFHESKLLEHELGIVTSHYKWADDKTKEAVINFLDRQSPVGECRYNHACLIGYDWNEYSKLSTDERESFINNFKSIYLKDISRIYNLFEKRYKGFKFKHYNLEVFFLPFKSVQEFRNAFLNAIS